MKDTLTHFMHDLYIVTGIASTIYQAKEEKELLSFPAEFLNCYQKDFLNNLIDKLGKNSNKKIKPVIELNLSSELNSDTKIDSDTEKVLLYYIHEFLFCSIARLGSDLYVITAPHSPGSIKPNFTPLSLSKYIVPKKLNYFLQRFHTFPHKENYALVKFVSLCKYLYCGLSVSDTIIEYNKETILNPASSPMPSLDVPAPENFQRHLNFAHIDNMADSIAKGDYSVFLQYHSNTFNGAAGRMSMDDLRQAKYTFICAANTFSRSAIKGGVPFEYAMKLNDDYCQYMDTLTSPSQVIDLILTVSKEYCEKVMNFKKISNYKNSTKKCCEYINTHLYTKIRLEDLENAAHLNRRSLSIYFREDTGKSINDYIQHKRLEQAKLLLSDKNYSIIQISELLCYSSQSYFGRKFKGYFNITPLEYRDSLEHV